MKIVILSILLLSSVVCFGQQTFFNVDYGDNQDHWKTYAKIVVTVTESQLIIEHYSELNSRLPVVHTYEIISTESEGEYIVKLQPLKNTSYRMLTIDSDKLSFHKVNSGNTVFHYYSVEGIGDVIK